MPKSKSRKRASAKPAQQVDVRVNVISITILLASIGSGVAATAAQRSPHGIIIMQSPKVARQWERAVVLRLGKYQGLRGPGLFWIVPFIDTVTSWIDQRVITTNFNAEE